MQLYKIILRYIWKYKIYSAVIIYLILSAALNTFLHINIGIPCLWRTIFGVRCPGCGLTTAFGELLRFNFVGAFKQNPLIFIVLPSASVFIIIDFIKFRKEFINKTKVDMPDEYQD